MFYIVGIIYAVGFLVVGWKRPAIPLMLVFALAPFQNDISAITAQQDPDDPALMASGAAPPPSTGAGLHFSIAEINLMLATLLFLMRRRRMMFGPILIPTLLYFAVCGLSSFFNWRSTTMTSMNQMVLYLVIAVVVFTSLPRTGEDYRLAFHGLICVGTFLALAVLITRSGYVLGLHKNGVGGSLSCAVIVCCELWLAAETRRRRMVLSWVMAIMVAGLVFTLSRGAWLGAFCGVSVILIARRRVGMLVRVGIALIPLIAICWHFLPQQSKQYATGLGKENWNIKMRYQSLYFARDLFEQSPWIGMGVGLRKEYDATNLFWLTLAETGVLGIVTLLGLHFAFLRMVWSTQKRLRRNETLYSVVIISGALVTSKLIHGMVDHYWSRGPIMITWTAAGMATYGYFMVRQREAAVRAARRQVLFLAEQQTA